MPPRRDISSVLVIRAGPIVIGQGADVVEAIIAKERPDALLATLGGQTALNTAIALAEAGVLDKYSVELIGANVDAIQAGGDRQRFKEVVERVADQYGLQASVARAPICSSIQE